MTLTPAANATLVDVLDRVLDKGIVIDGWHKYGLAGVDLGHIESQYGRGLVEHLSGSGGDSGGSGVAVVAMATCLLPQPNEASVNHPPG